MKLLTNKSCGLAVAGLLLFAGAARSETVEEFAKRMEAVVAKGDAAAVAAFVNHDVLVHKITRDVDVPPGMKQKFAAGLSGSGKQLFDQLFKKQGATGSYRYLRTVKRNGDDRALFRVVDGAGGLNYHELETVADSNGKRTISDFYFYASGEDVSQTIRRNYLQLAKGPNDPAAIAMADAINGVRLAQQAGDYQAALAAFDQLPENLKKDKLLNFFRVQAAMQLPEETYKAVLADYAAKFGKDATLSLFAIDVHLLGKQFDKAIQAVDELDKMVGGDPYLNVTRAGIYTVAGEKQRVKPLQEDALKREPTLLPAAEGLLTDALERSDFKAACDMMLRMEQEMNFEFGPYAQIEIFKDFVASPEAARFEKERPRK